MFKRLVLAFSILIFSVFSYAGDIPRVILHQGYLTDTSGNPINGNVNISFGIYETQSGGTPVLEEDVGSVNIKDGFYALEIGKNSNLYPLFSDKYTLFLEVRINNEPLSPRQRIGAVPFAFVSYDVVGDIHPTSITIGGKKIIDEGGKWVGDSSSIPGVKSITALSPLTGGTITDSGNIGIQKASDTYDGYLSKEDYLIFIGKQNRITGYCNSGTCVTKINEDGSVVCDLCGGGGGSVSISAGVGIVVDPNPIIGVGTISIDKTYFDNLYIQQGQPASITEPMIADGAISKEKLNSSGCINGQILKYSGSTGRWECAADEVSSGGGLVNITGANGISVTPDPITSNGTISLTSEYQDGSAYDSRFVNENQPNSITSVMIGNGVINNAHIQASSINIDRLAQSGCSNGQTIKYNDIAGNWICASDNNTTYSAGIGLSLSGTVFSIKNNIFQCTSANQSIKTINIDTGIVTCEMDDDSGGTVTTIDTGAGLTGGPITTSGTISLASNYIDGSAYDSRFVNENQPNSITSAMIVDGTITGSDIANGTITLSKLAKSGCSNGQVVKYYVEQPGVEYFMCDTDLGITSCNTCDSTFVNENQPNSITSSMIVDGTITGADIANDTITNSNLATGTYSNITGVGTLGTLTVSGNTYLAATSGNVGIGTSSPSEKLHIYKTSSSGGYTGIKLTYNYTGPVNGTRSSEWNLNATSANGSFQIANVGGAKIHFDGETDYVGIGNTSPTQKLDVTGNIRASGQLISGATTGTAPIVVNSTTLVSKLNADMVDDWHAAVFLNTGAGPDMFYGTNQTTFVEIFRLPVDFDSIPGNTIKILGYVTSQNGGSSGEIILRVNGSQEGDACVFSNAPAYPSTSPLFDCKLITYKKPTGVGYISILIRNSGLGAPDTVYFGQATLILK